MNPVTLLASTAYTATLQALNADGSVNTSAIISNPTLTFSATSGTFSSAQPVLSSGSTFTFTTDGVDTDTAVFTGAASVALPGDSPESLTVTIDAVLGQPSTSGLTLGVQFTPA